jgi:transketolase
MNDYKLNPDLYSKPESLPSRNGFGDGLVEAADKDIQVVGLCADLVESTRMQAFADKYPDRYIEMGVAEQNLAAVASGLAAVGKIPFISSYATFSPGRNWEQIRTTICYNNQPVKIVGSHAGISVGPDGATHQALEDIAIMRALPNMMVVVPVDSHQAKKATTALAQTGLPGYLRLSRSDVPIVTSVDTPFELGKAQVFKQGKDATVIACGQMVYQALLAAQICEEQGISIEVINCHTIKPLDDKTILQSVEKTRAVVTAEEHQINGGLGGAVAELVSAHYPVPIKIIGVEDRFGESGQPDELLEKFGLTAEHIKKAILAVIRMKGDYA